jgi:hypothetical protein
VFPASRFGRVGCGMTAPLATTPQPQDGMPPGACSRPRPYRAAEGPSRSTLWGIDRNRMVGWIRPSSMVDVQAMIPPPMSRPMPSTPEPRYDLSAKDVAERFFARRRKAKWVTYNVPGSRLFSARTRLWSGALVAQWLQSDGSTAAPANAKAKKPARGAGVNPQYRRSSYDD